MISYAVIKASGRQYRVSPGDTLSVEKIEGKAGDTIEIKDVLMIGGEKLLVGAPLVSGASVSLVIEQQYRGEKVLVFKKKRRHKYRKMRGHRSELTRLFVSAITSPSGSFKADSKPNIWTEEKLAEKKSAAAQTAKAEDSGEVAKMKPAKKMAAKPAKKKSASAKKKAGAKKTAKKKAKK